MHYTLTLTLFVPLGDVIFFTLLVILQTHTKDRATAALSGKSNSHMCNVLDSSFTANSISILQALSTTFHTHFRNVTEV